jgi:hypothetical protein
VVIEGPAPGPVGSRSGGPTLWSLARLLGLVVEAGGPVWRASSRLVVALVSMQVVSAVGFGSGLLVMQPVVALLLDAQRAHLGLAEAAPLFALLALTLSAVAFAGCTFANSVQMLLAEQVSELAFSRSSTWPP